MGCSNSTLQQTSVTSDNYVPIIKELSRPIKILPGEPSLVLFHENDVSSDDQIHFAIQKTNRNQTGDSFRVMNQGGDIDFDMGSWNEGRHLFVEPIYKFGGPRMSLEGTTGVYQGDAALPVAYWTRDVARGKNHFKILREKPVYSNQAKAFTIAGRDQKDVPIKTATPFVGRTSVDFYSYANVVFDRDTKIASIKVYGAPKCKNGVPLYQMHQATEFTWVLYRFSHDEERYTVCAVFKKVVGKRKELPLYETVIAPHVDPVFILCLGSILDSYWTYRLKKPRLKLFG